MAVIHNTTMNPSKLDLLAAWLPAQPWYRPTGQAPELARAGGFRLDDPQGEAGIEFMVVTDGAGDRAIAYQIPMTYRAGALAGADGALIGTSEHGVLGLRWLYDGVHDPVLRAQLIALIQGRAVAQAQSVSNTADPTVIVQPVAVGSPTPAWSEVVANGPSGTDRRAASSPWRSTGSFSPATASVRQLFPRPGARPMAHLSAAYSPRPATRKPEHLGRPSPAAGGGSRAGGPRWRGRAR